MAHKRNFKTPGPKLAGYNSSNRFINKKRIKLFDDTYQNFLDAELDLELNAANLDYIDEMRPEPKKRNRNILK